MISTPSLKTTSHQLHLIPRENMEPKKSSHNPPTGQDRIGKKRLLPLERDIVERDKNRDRLVVFCDSQLEKRQPTDHREKYHSKNLEGMRKYYLKMQR